MELKTDVLTRAKHGVVSGVLSGLSQYYNLKLWKLRLVFSILLFFGIGIVMYLVLWASISSYTKREDLLKALEINQE